MNRQQRNQAITRMRQAAVIANSAVDHMDRAAQKQNPERFLRRWTAQLNNDMRVKMVKEMGK